MAHDSASPDTLIDLVEVPSPFWSVWSRSDDDFSPSKLFCHEDTNMHDFIWHCCCVYTRCSICGLHITEDSGHAPPANGTWASEALMIGDLSREYEYVQTKRKYPASCQDPVVFSARIADLCSDLKGCGYYLGPQGHTGPCFPYAADVNSRNGGPDGKNIVYLPMHRACFNIALRSPRWDETSSTRLRALFRVLRHRFQVKWEQCLWRFPEAHEDDNLAESRQNDDSTIKMSGFQNTRGIERGYFSQGCLDVHFWAREHYLLCDPLNIPLLTNTILKNLESRNRPENTKKISAFRKCLRKLPNELKLLIYEYLVEEQEWPLECTKLLGPRFWKALFNKDNPCMGWLWDLDFGLVRRTDPDLKMDWELLFRKLSQGPQIPDCFGGHADSDYETFRGVLAHVPPGLEGRRRVWKLVEEMRIGDRSTQWEINPGLLWRRDRYETLRDLKEVPVYWGSNGEPLDEEELGAL